MSTDDIRHSLARHLAIDRLLGIRTVPLKAPLIRPPAAGTAPAGRATPARAPVPVRGASAPPPATTAMPPAAPPPRVAPATALQNISPGELARREKELRALDEQQVSGCRRCGLCETRNKTVFGQGHAGARLVFVGEAPGADEDAQGLAFVGKAGQLLSKMIEAMGLSRDQVFICNILKCRPPNNRDPAPNEVTACWPYLDQQLRIIQPEIIVALGKPASQTLLRTTESIGRLRGTWHQYFASGMPGVGAPTMLMPTFHPAYLLRSPGEKGKTWSDLKMVMQQLGLPLPAR